MSRLKLNRKLLITMLQEKSCFKNLMSKFLFWTFGSYMCKNVAKNLVRVLRNLMKKALINISVLFGFCI